MKTTVNFSEFCDRFAKMDRNENFSYAGKHALFDYLEELEADTGEEIEFDCIGLCCEWTEYATAFEAVEQYDEAEAQRMALSVFNEYGFVKGMNDDYPEWRRDADLWETCISWLNQHTQVIEFDGGVIIKNY